MVLLFHSEEEFLSIEHKNITDYNVYVRSLYSEAQDRYRKFCDEHGIYTSQTVSHAPPNPSHSTPIKSFNLSGSAATSSSTSSLRLNFPYVGVGNESLLLGRCLGRGGASAQPLERRSHLRGRTWDEAATVACSEERRMRPSFDNLGSFFWF